MATVKGMTPEEILELIGETIVQGEINSSGDLILTTKGGDVYNAGHVGGGGGGSYDPGSSSDSTTDVNLKVWSPQQLNGFIDLNVPVISVQGKTGALTLRLDELSSPTANVDLASQRIINLADPTAASDAATKNYIDLLVQGFALKTPVRVATTTNITLSGTQTIDSISVVAGDRVLVKNQTTASQNGIYVCSAGAWSRSTDTDTWNELISAYVFVQVGGQQDNGYLCTVDAGGTLGTTAVTWIQFTGAGQITPGSGLSKSGNTLSVATNGITNTMLADGAVNLASADVTGSLPVANGGTAGTTSYEARYNLGVPGASNGLLPALTAGVWTTVVSLGALGEYSGMLCEFHDDTTKERVLIDYRTNGTPANLQVRADIDVAVNTIRYALMARGT